MTVLRMQRPANAPPDRFFCAGGCGRQGDANAGPFESWTCAWCSRRKDLAEGRAGGPHICTREDPWHPPLVWHAVHPDHATGAEIEGWTPYRCNACGFAWRQ